MKYSSYFQLGECIQRQPEVMKDIITLLVMHDYITCYAPLHYLLCFITLFVMRHYIICYEMCANLKTHQLKNLQEYRL